MRSFIRNRILDMLGTFSKPANGVHILNGHMISRNPSNSSEQQFYRLLEGLKRDVNFIRIEEAVEIIKRQENVTSPLVAFTFDDGFMDCYDSIVPVIEDFGVNAAFFVNPNFIEGDEQYVKNFTDNVVLTHGKIPMRWNEIVTLQKNGHIIGAHTMDHYMINTGSRDILEYQIGECKRVLEEKLNTKCDYFAFPYGRLEHANKEAIDIACKYYPYVFSQSDYKNYFSFNGRVINRRHFEPFWPEKHVRYFLSCKKK